MKGEAFIYRPETEAIERMTFSGPVPLEIITQAVGGHIEAVPFWSRYHGKRCVAFCNEEGKLHGLAFNEHATVAWFAAIGVQRTRMLNDVLVGPVIVLTGDEEFMETL